MRNDFENERANEYADNYGLLKVAASDNHVGRIKRYCGIKTAKRVRDMREMAELIRRGEVELFTEYEDAE